MQCGKQRHDGVVPKVPRPLELCFSGDHKVGVGACFDQYRHHRVVTVLGGDVERSDAAAIRLVDRNVRRSQQQLELSRRDSVDSGGQRVCQSTGCLTIASGTIPQSFMVLRR